MGTPRTQRLIALCFALVALALCLRRNYLWGQLVDSAFAAQPSTGFEDYRSTAVYHVPWVRMAVPLLINVAFVWMPWLIGNIISSTALLWTGYIYTVWAKSLLEINTALASGDSKLDALAWEFYEPHWHDVAVLLLVGSLLVWQILQLAVRFRRPRNQKGA